MNQSLNPFISLHQQPERVLPVLWEHKSVIDSVLPFFLAVSFKASGKPASELFAYNIQALEVIFGSDKQGKGPTELAISEYAYLLNARIKDVFDKLP